MRVLVIGGTLFIGRALVQTLLDAGHEVTILHRTPGHTLDARVQEIIADRNDPVLVAAAVSGQAFDLVFDNVYDWQRGTRAEQVLGCAEALRPAHRYVFVSSVAAYGDGVDHDEDDPLGVGSPADYTRHKATSEVALLKSGIPVATIRPPFIYGPGNPFYREAFLWDRMRAGRPVVLPSGGDRLMQFVHIDDLVDALLLIAFHPEAENRAFNVGNRPITQAAFVDLLGRLTGKPYQVVDVPREFLLEQGGGLLGPNLYFGEYMDLEPISGSTARLESLGWGPRDLEEGFRGTYEWYLGQDRGELGYGWLDDLLMGLR